MLQTDLFWFLLTKNVNLFQDEILGVGNRVCFLCWITNIFCIFVINNKFIEVYEIFNYSNPIINRVSLDFKRYLFNDINWEARLIEILGGRGVGKTTLMLQRAKMLNAKVPNQAVYLSLDDKLMFRNSIVGLAEELEKYGVRYLFLDEVHKYPPKLKDYDWSAEIKKRL